MDEHVNQTNEAAPQKNVSVRIFGVGGAGLKILEHVAKAGLSGATLVAVDTDEEPLSSSHAAEKLHLPAKRQRHPAANRVLSEEHSARLKAACEGANVVFVVAGLGGNAGTSISPVLAQAAKETGALVLALVALPFQCEGNRRQSHAEQGLELLKATGDGVITLPNQKILKLVDENTSVVDTFKTANELLAEGLSSVWHLMANKGLIEIHFADLCGLLRDRHGESSFATAEAMGPTRSRDVVDKLLAHPMLDGGKILSEADAVLVNLMGGPDLAMGEINRVMEQINGKCADAQVIMGAVVREEFRERLAVTIIATRHPETLLTKAGIDEAAHTEAARFNTNLGEQLLSRETSVRPNSRFVPPPPSLPPEQMEQLMMTNGTARRRRATSKMRQGQLPLEIVSKGRFDKSEPTIHKGEDLDVPTYIRRGVALN